MSWTLRHTKERGSPDTQHDTEQPGLGGGAGRSPLPRLQGHKRTLAPDRRLGTRRLPGGIVRQGQAPGAQLAFPGKLSDRRAQGVGGTVSISTTWSPGT